MRSPRRPAGGIAAAAASANPYPGYAPTGPTAPPHPAALYPAAASAAVGSGAGVAAAADGIVLAAGPTAGAPMPGEIEALASQLMAAGFLVQIRDGTRHSKDARSCLRTLKHRFLVCLGWQPTGAAGSGTLAPTQLLEPLVVEPRFREQFLIANPSRDYGLLLLVSCKRHQQVRHPVVLLSSCIAPACCSQPARPPNHHFRSQPRCPSRRLPHMTGRTLPLPNAANALFPAPCNLMPSRRRCPWCSWARCAAWTPPWH